MSSASLAFTAPQRSALRFRVALLGAALLLAGCRSQPAATSASASAAKPTPAAASYPPRPAVAPAPFTLFHRTDSSLTLVVPPSTGDAQLAALVWALRDAARTHSFSRLHLPQAFFDARDPIVFLHIYRGSRCASEKYAAGDPPCGGSYHAAADFTLGSFKVPNRTDGVLHRDADHQTELWDPDAP